MRKLLIALLIVSATQAYAQVSSADTAKQLLDRAQAILENQFDTTLGRVDQYEFEVPYFENVSRKVRVYRPAHFFEGSTYSVIYMHDGQNLYEDSTSFLGEWKVDEVLDSLRQNNGVNCIVVGIDNTGEHRMQEYNPFSNAKWGRGYGQEYVDWIVNKLVPIIDSIYPTAATPYNTSIMGSSMGGLISHYALLRYPTIFGSAGVFSPSYWICDKELTALEKVYTLQQNQKVYVLAGGKEGRHMKKLTKKHVKHLQKIATSSATKVEWVFDADGMHNEAFWTNYLGQAFTFLLN
jgi:predicted alpha/beta superfamily hydrolase